MTVDSAQVAQYLKERPEFFEQYADLLAEINIPDPHGGRAIPLTERQISSLREKCRKLEVKLRELIECGEANDSILERLHRLALALMISQRTETLLHALYFHLREDFAVPHVALRLWNAPSPPALPEFEAVSEEARTFAEALSHPRCGPHSAAGTLDWFGEDAPHLKSFAYVELRGEKCRGLLALASEDAERFYPSMGTLYLKRLGELLSAALERCLTVISESR
jgi:uncharacterized protein